MHRLIGEFGGRHPGVLVLILAALHGNEPAGVQAFKRVIKMLHEKAAADPAFIFRGKVTGLLGNQRAYASGVRFVQKDLNRQWIPDNIRRIGHMDARELTAEDLEIVELLEVIHREIEKYEPRQLVLLDLHTTSAGGGVFSIPTDESESLRLAKALHAPVILDMFNGVQGTLLRFASNGHFQIGGFPKHTVGIAFEAGQHDDPQSVERSVSAIVNILRTAGCVGVGDLSGPHDAVLKHGDPGTPKVTRLVYVHHIRPGDDFRMRPGYSNFQPVRADETLADDVTGPILSPGDGLILMPLYQPKGSDGFFIVEPVS